LAYCRRGDAHKRAGDLDAAITDYSAAIRIEPRYTLGYSGRAEAYVRAGAFSPSRDEEVRYVRAAIADYEHYLRVRPDAPDRGEVEAALRELRRRM
jgi:tetratricopeptide (TPR) repeat protein